MALHNSQKLDYDFRARSDEDLTLASSFGVVDGIERIIENTGSDHCDSSRFSTGNYCKSEVSRDVPFRLARLLSPPITPWRLISAILVRQRIIENQKINTSKS